MRHVLHAAMQGWSLLLDGRYETKLTASFVTLTGVTVEWLCPTLSGPLM